MFSACQAQNMLEKTATVGKNITIPCGVQVKGNLTRLVWKRGDVTRTENMAHMYDGVRQCDVTQKQNCFLRQDGSLELPNVQETDSGDYVCVADDENYYSKHTLVVHPEVAFEGCPNPDVVSVIRVGPDMKILTYTSPECKNADVVGIVSCHPPSGAKVGMNVTEINCTCTHSGKMTDICMIPIPDASPSFEDDSELEAFCPVFPWFFGGIAIGIGLGVLATSIVVLLLHKRNKFSLIPQSPDMDLNRVPTKPEFTSLPKQLTVDIGKSLELKCQVEGHPIPTPYWYKDGKQLDPQAGYKTTFSEGVATLTISNAKEGDKGMFSCVAVNSAGDAITSCNVVVEESTVSVQVSDHATSDLVDGGSHTVECDSHVTDSGQPFSKESDSTVVDVSDANTKTTPLLATCNEIRGFVVEDIASSVRILPSRTNCTEGITISCKHNENLTVGYIQRGSSTLPNLNTNPNIGEMTISVADKTAIPLSIQCLRCGTVCCILEVCGGEWSDKECEDGKILVLTMMGVKVSKTCSEEDEGGV